MVSQEAPSQGNRSGCQCAQRAYTVRRGLRQTDGMASMERSKRICVRLAPSEEKLLKDAAWERRLSLSEWVRQVMLAEAKKSKR